MKKQYEKPMMAVERYALTQAIAGCVRRIGFYSAECVQKDADATSDMKDLAWGTDIAWFYGEACEFDIAFYIGTDGESNGEDGVCYHTNANAAFGST